jgi:hypothetical protein
MIRNAKVLALLIFALALAGCVTVENQPFNKAAHSQIKTIAILPAPPVPDYSINILHHPAGGFGLIGGLVIAAELTHKGTQFTASMQQEKFDVAKALNAAVQKEVEQRGYKVVVLDDLKRPEPKLLESYGDVKAGADAYLDLVITTAGYWANSHSTPYYPQLSTPVRLVNAKDGAIVYNSLMVYGPFGGPKGATRLSPDGSYAPANFDALQASPARSADGLRSAVQAVAKQIAADL